MWRLPGPDGPWWIDTPSSLRSRSTIARSPTAAIV
jgi:hypothetical protein